MASVHLADTKSLILNDHITDGCSNKLVC